MNNLKISEYIKKLENTNGLIFLILFVLNILISTGF